MEVAGNQHIPGGDVRGTGQTAAGVGYTDVPKSDDRWELNAADGNVYGQQQPRYEVHGYPWSV